MFGREVGEYDKPYRLDVLGAEDRRENDQLENVMRKEDAR